MNKKTVFGLIGLFLISFFVMQEVSAVLNDSIAYWSFSESNSTVADSATGNAHYLNITGSPVIVSGKLDNARYMATGAYYRPNNNSDFNVGTGSFTIMGWLNVTTTKDSRIFSKQKIASNYLGYTLAIDEGTADGKLHFRAYNGGSYDFEFVSPTTLTNAGWTHFAVMRNAVTGRALMYINGLLVNNVSSGSTNYDITDLLTICGNSAGSGSYCNGTTIDEISFYKRALSDNEVNASYNSGNGYNPFNASSTNITNTTFTFHSVGLYSNAGIYNVSITTPYGNCTTFFGTNACTISTNASFNGTAYVPFNASKTGYWNTSGSAIVNNTVEVNMASAVYSNISVYSLITGDAVSPPFNLSVNDGGRNYTINESLINIYLIAGPQNFTLTKTGWLPLTFTRNITALTNTTTNATGFYNSLLNITAKNALINTSIANFSINASNSSYSTQSNTTNGTLYIPWIQGIGAYLFIDADGYSYANTTLNISNSTPSYQFTLYTNNSINIMLYSEDTGLSMSGTNVTIITTGSGNYSSTNYTTTGTFYIDNLPEDVYTLKFLAENYTLRTYTVTVAGRSTQQLNAYLTAATNTVIFTTRDALTGLTVEDVSITQYRIINSTLTPIETKTTDITGRAQFIYTYGYKYTFQVSKTGYDSKIFSLDPVLFSSYDISLDRTIVEQSSYSDVYIDFTPSYFVNNQTTNFSFLFNSANGVLSEYNLSVTYPGGTYNGTGLLANGQTFLTILNITGATLTSTVLINFTYATVLGEVKSATYLFLVEGGTATGQLANIRNNTYGMGLFERILLATLIVIFSAGIASIFAGRFIGLLIGLVSLIFLGMIGFVPWAYTYISLLMGILLAYKVGGSEDG